MGENEQIAIPFVPVEIAFITIRTMQRNATALTKSKPQMVGEFSETLSSGVMGVCLFHSKILASQSQAHSIRSVGGGQTFAAAPASAIDPARPSQAWSLTGARPYSWGRGQRFSLASGKINALSDSPEA
jgi:hypothetical protein